MPTDSATTAIEATYKTRHIDYFGEDVVILLQNAGSRSALVEIFNVLLLRNEVESTCVDAPEVPMSTLITLLEDLLYVSANRQNFDEESMGSLQQNLWDAIQCLPCLATDLEIDIRFTNIHDFVLTPECTVFDVLRVDFVHGLVCGPQDIRGISSTDISRYSINTFPRLRKGDEEELRELELAKELSMYEYDHFNKRDVGSCSSNGSEDNLSTSAILSTFVQQHPAGVTPHGLNCLKRELDERKLYFFYGNYTMLKHEQELYLLVNDERCLERPEIVWEKLNMVIKNKTPVTCEWIPIEE